MTDRPRAVFDTNVFVSAFLSRNPSSPTDELLRRWLEGEITLLVSQVLLDEIIDKLREKGISEERIIALAGALLRLAEWVDVAPEAVQPVLADPDDDHVLACATVGKAEYLVTYDPDFEPLGGTYAGIRILSAPPFLWILRGDARAAKAE